MFPDIDYTTNCCTACGKLRVTGDWPQCPHGRVIADETRATVFQDSIPGGLVLENYGPHPITVYSHTERRQVLERNGLELRERFSPLPGTDKDPAGIPNPKGYVDPYTLEAGKALILRAQKAEVKFDPSTVLKFTPTQTLTTSEAREIASLVERTGL